MVSENVTQCSEKKKRNVFTVAQKIEIIGKIERGVICRVFMHEYNIGSAAIYDLKTQKDELLDFADGSENISKATGECKYLRKPN
jgi:hypothetical protein